MYKIDLMQQYKDRDAEHALMSIYEYGLIRMVSLVKIRKRKLISKTAYNEYRKAIEKQLLNI